MKDETRPLFSYTNGGANRRNQERKSLAGRLLLSDYAAVAFIFNSVFHFSLALRR